MRHIAPVPVYMIVEIEGKDPGTYADYMKRVPATAGFGCAVGLRPVES